MLEEKVLNDYKEAMKSRNSLASSVLSFLRAEFKNVAIAKKKDMLDDNDCISVIRKQIKNRQDSIEQFKAGNRMDLAQKESKEEEILKAYLPAELPVEQIKAMIEEVISLTAAQSIKDMGKVMKELTARLSGKADSKMVSDMVKERLTSPA